MGKLPAILFYTGDWLKDTAPLPLDSRGAWIDLLCYMFNSKERGVLSLTFSEYGRLLRASKKKTKKVILELIGLEICDCYLGEKKIEKPEILKNVTNCSKKITLINRRMFNEVINRNYTRARVIKHRMKQKGNIDETTCISSSVSVSKNNIKKHDCNKCKFGIHKRENFFCCEHPDIEKLGIKTAKKKLCIVGKEEKEWFDWPKEFNINWLFNCEGYSYV